MKKIIINAPILSRSGYGEMSRFALKCLRKHQDKFDIYVNVINWGATGYLFEDNEEFQWIKFLRMKTEQFVKQNGVFDISLQITIPSNFIIILKCCCQAMIKFTFPQWLTQL